ncbi:MAG: heavy-metal-associated domain-containing protein [Anaerolineae bacterium]|nr:heavy-metal-associated domain-containing protein [Anaerolineae bacterium]
MSTVIYVEPFDKPIDREALFTATTAFFAVMNMECSHCALWIRNGLLKLDGVLLVDIFQQQAVAVVTFDPRKVAVGDLVKAIYRTGEEICHFYGAELLGQEPAVRALHLDHAGQDHCYGGRDQDDHLP